MKLKGLVFLAAYTSRSRAYAQAMAKAGLEPEKTIFFGGEGAGKPGQVDRDVDSSGEAELFLPDMSKPLEETIARAGWKNVQIVPAENINDQIVIDALSLAAPEVVLFSGYGAQLVKGGLLGMGVPLLHAHSGWLPAFRGSTTMYYSALIGGDCGVSVIILGESIDTGPILARKKYPLPSPCVDPDHVYDGAIRADLMTEVLAHYAKEGALPPEINASEEEGTDYYVIHPVLKHVSRLSMEAAAGEAGRP